MVKKTGKKTNKNLFLPEWLIPLLDTEGERFGGPGVVAAAAIHHLLALPVKDRMAVVDAYRAAEVQKAYAGVDESSLVAQTIEQSSLDSKQKKALLDLLGYRPVAPSDQSSQKGRAGKFVKAG